MSGAVGFIRGGSFVLSLVWMTLACAQTENADTELARTYFDTGTAHYIRGEFARAIVAFEEARRLRPLPALDYDIARCNDRLGKTREALQAYQRYLDTSTTIEHVAEVRGRVVELRGNLERHRLRYIVPGALAGADLAVAAVATGLVASVAPALDTLADRYRVAPTAALQNDAHALERRADAGYALFGLAGALAVVDIALWIVAARRDQHLAR